MTKITESIRNKKIFFGVLSCLLMFGPLLYYTILALINGKSTQSRLILLMTLICAIMMTILGIISKLRLRSPVFIVMLGIYKCLSSITGMLIIFGICTIIDEVIVTPMYKHYRNRYVINKEIDARVNV